MAKALIGLPLGVTWVAGPGLLVDESATVGDAPAVCAAKEPRPQKRIFRQDGTPWSGVVVDRRDAPPEKVRTAIVQDGDGIRLLPPIMGGC